MEQYGTALCRFLRQMQTDLPVDTIYFGGGTPSLLSVSLLEEILQTIDKTVSLQQPEITLECNPATVDRKTLQQLREIGINRLSIGVQSLSDVQLKRLGRLHDAQTAIETVEQAAAAGFQNLSCDVMLALPKQTTAELQGTLTQLTALPIQHISAYLLKVEPETPFASMNWVQQLPDEDAIFICRRWKLYKQLVSCNMKSPTLQRQAMRVGITANIGTVNRIWGLGHLPIPAMVESGFMCPRICRRSVRQQPSRQHWKMTTPAPEKNRFY